MRADAGCIWGDVDHATVAFGMATPSGFLAERYDPDNTFHINQNIQPGSEPSP